MVANVNGEPILESQLKIAELFYGLKDRKKLIDKLVENHLIAQFLRQQGFNVPESYLEEVIKDMAKRNNKTLEEFYKELYSLNLTPEDLKDFLRVELAATFGLREYLRREIKISEIEIELERLKKGEIKYAREIELLVVPKDKKELLLEKITSPEIDLKQLAKDLGVELERLTVKKGELIKPLEREVWRTKPGQLAIAEDEENIYLAKVKRVVRIISGRSEDEIKREIFKRKFQERVKELVTDLRKKSFVEVYG